MSVIELSAELLILLFVTGLLAGMVDAIAGGGGLIALPALLATGMPPTQALATNKLQGSFGTFSSSLYFIRNDLIKLGELKLMIACTFVGAVAGTLVVQRISTQFLAGIIPLLLIGMALYFLLSPTISDEHRNARITPWLFSLTVGFGVGFYDGFFGPGAGSFFAIGFVGLLGFGLTRATAHTKVLNLTSNLASLSFFILSGHVVWSIGLIMGVGQLIGARFGARLVLKRGVRLIRPMIVLVCILISAKLLLENYPALLAWSGLTQH
ncbi:TSUP family transporter [Sedimenticola thiotaurini]|uniref:TSUP family transporter n=1 Tax=Sedimenticola thiotaurini TaxID=1543721 RepID=UPI000AF20CD0|nr:TSUP family transporter [Sedimenticola thiotaurini]